METQINHSRHYSKLTPAAKEFIAGVDHDFQELIVKDVLALAKKRKAIDEKISVVDVLNITDKLIDFNSVENKKNLIAWIAVLGAVLFGAAGILDYLVQYGFVFEKIDWIFSTIIALNMLGFTWIVYDFVRIKTFKNKQVLSCQAHDDIMYLNNESELVLRWEIIEQEAKKVMLQKEKRVANNESATQVISYLMNIVAEDSNDSAMTRELLNVRNRILLEEYTLTEVQRRTYLQYADNLIRKLEDELQEF
jgi:hypothetical protein